MPINKYSITQGYNATEINKVFNELVKVFKEGQGNIAASVDALHSTPPTDEEIIQLLVRENSNIDNANENIADIIKKINNRVKEIKKQNPKYSHKRILRQILSENGSDKLYRRIICLNKLYEQGTGVIAEIAAKVAQSSLIISCSRIKEDWNRPEDAEEISNKVGKPLEKSIKAHILEKYIYLKLFSKHKLLDGENKIVKPYLHVSVHGCAKFKNGFDVFIANGIKDGGKLPCDPQVARWFRNKIVEAIRENNLVNNQGNLLKVHIAVEGQRLSGSTANVRRRWGLNGIVEGWGKMFQYIQLEIGPYGRSFYRKEFGQIIGKIIKQFIKEFSSTIELNKYLQASATKIDKIREKGALFIKHPYYSKRVKEKEVYINSDCRNALCNKDGDTILINILDDNDDIVKTNKAIVRNTHYALSKKYISLPYKYKDLIRNGIVVYMSNKIN